MQKFIYFIFLSLLFFSCKEKMVEVVEEPPFQRDWDEIVESGELTVITSYGATSYFIYRSQDMGYQYELARRFARDMKLKLHIKVVEDENQMYEMLRNGEGDLIAYRVPVTKELKQEFSYTHKKDITHQVLVQPKSDTMVTSLIGLIGKEVYVLENSKYEQRLKNLNNELGGGIIIKTVPNVTGVDELIDMVSLGKIPFTIADDDVALLNKTYLKNIDTRLSVSFFQSSGWVVRKTSPQLLRKVNQWLDAPKNNWFLYSMYHKYYKKNEYFSDKKISLYEGYKISPYDDLFKKYAKEISWDWRLLASMGFYESTFDTTSISSAGAVGLMQIMPETAGMTEEELMNPEENLKASVAYIKKLDRIFKEVEDDEQRIKFIIASYNVGLGHVFDAMTLAEKYGKEKYVWDDNVEVYLKLKSNPDYYNDPLLKNGYCRCDGVGDYVNNIFIRYQRYKNLGVK